jgi:hypothetical protein
VDSPSLEEQLAQRTMEDYPYNFNFTPVFTDVLQREDGDRTLMLVRTEGTPHAAGLEHLLLGVYDESVHNFVGDSWDIGGDEGLYACWTGEDGGFSLLCTNSVTYQGEESSCGLFYYRFADGELERLYTVPDAAFSTGLLSLDDQGAQAMLYDCVGEEEANDLAYSFWENRKCVPLVGGFDLYERNSLYDAAMPIHGEEPWNYVGFIPLADTPLDSLSEGKTGGGSGDTSYN